MNRVALLILVFVMFGCQPSLNQQPRLDVYEKETFFANESADRDPLPDTRPYLSHELPRPELTKENLKRGQERFEIFCAVCHGSLGDGQGIVTKHGFTPPPSFHTDSARSLGDEDVYDIISHGRGRMTRLGDRIDPKDRWAIVGYLRALQLSQFTPIKSLSHQEQRELPP